MKKLMTLVSAVALAVGLRAADTGTSFEGMSAGDLDITSSTDELAAGTSGYWVTNGSETVSLKVVEGISIPHDVPGGISRFNEDQERYLSVKSSFGNPVTRKIQPGSQGALVDAGFYYDSLVKFTAFDEDPMTTAVTNDFDGAKIAVWAREVYEGDVVTGTNLYIRAGYLGGEPRTYDCGGLLNPGAWKRLTIKAISNIYASGTDVPGFVVYIDGAPVGALDYATNKKGIDEANLNPKYTTAMARGALYPSMVQPNGAEDIMLFSVSFDGQGDVDDILFTADAPEFAADDAYVFVDWNVSDVASVTLSSYESIVTNNGAARAMISLSEAESLTVGVTYAEGKVAGAWTMDGVALPSNEFDFTAEGQVGAIVATAAAASFQGTAYATLAEAIEAAEEASASLPPPVLKLYSTSDSDDIDIDAQTLIVLDLNGQEIGKIDSTGALQIIDSVGGGTVKGEVNLGDESVIDAGTFDDIVTLGEDSVINGGRFDKGMNEGGIEEFAAEGYEFVDGTGDDEGYLVLAEKAPEFAFEVTAGDNSYVSEVLIGGDDVTTAVTNGTLAVITSNATWSVTFTANSGYEFEGGLTTTNFTGTAEAAVAVTGPNATASSGGEPTIEPGQTSIDNVQAASVAEATNKVVVASPDASIVADEDYKKYFTLTATATGENTYTVSIAINKEAIELPETLEDVGGDLQDAAAAFGEDEDAAFNDVAAKPGLWYWIVTATDPAFTENVTPGTAVQAEGATVDLEAVKPANVVNGVFFKVCVDTVAPVAP